MDQVREREMKKGELSEKEKWEQLRRIYATNFVEDLIWLQNKIHETLLYPFTELAGWLVMRDLKK